MSAAKFELNALAEWIETTSGCQVNFEDQAGVTLQIPALRLHDRFLCHHAPTCEQRKIAGHQAECSQYKLTVLQQCADGRPRVSRCPWGIWDAVQPVVCESRPLGVFFIGGLCADRRAASAADRATPARKAAARRHARLLAETMQLIVAAWQAQGHALGGRQPPDFYLAAAERFIAAQFHRDISLRELAALLKLHPKYLGPLLKAAGGRTFREMLLAARLQKAKVYLRQSQLSVTAIAFACGFRDGNYFSTVFRRAVGVAPGSFRRSAPA